MSYVLDLQADSASAADDARMPSTWSIIGCASTLSVGLC